MAIASHVVTPEAWKRILRAALERAEGGDLKAAQWLATLLLGPTPPSLSDVLAAELAGVDVTEGKAVNLLAASESDEVIHAAEVRRIRQRIEQAEGEPDDDVDDDIPPEPTVSSGK